MEWRQVGGRFGILVQYAVQYPGARRQRVESSLGIGQLMESCVTHWIRVDDAIGCHVIRFDSSSGMKITLLPIDEKVS